jgi:hypothetical protein
LTEQQLEKADESETTKSDIVELIIQRETQPPEQFAAASSSDMGSAPSTPTRAQFVPADHAPFAALDEPASQPVPLHTQGSQQSVTTRHLSVMTQPTIQGLIQTGKHFKEKFFKLRVVDPHGVCLCQYKDEAEALKEEQTGGKVTKTRVPLYAVTKINRQQSDATERIKQDGQTNRFDVTYCGDVPKLYLNLLRCETSFNEPEYDNNAGGTEWIQALEYYAPLARGELEVAMKCTDADPKKWSKRFVTVQRGAITCFAGRDASSHKPSQPPYRITLDTRLQVIENAESTMGLPWMELSKRNVRTYSHLASLVLSDDQGATLGARLMLRSTSQSANTLGRFVKALHHIGPTLCEGVPSRSKQ